MRTAPLTALTLMTALVAPALAFASGGLQKHDASIANYNYSIAIQDENGGGTGGSLKADLDQGGAAAPQQVAQQVAMADAAPSMAAPMAAPMAAQGQLLAVGSGAPDFHLANAMGQDVPLAALLGQGPVVVLFTGNNAASLNLLQKNLPQFAKLNAQPVAIVPAAMRGMQAGFHVLTDVNGMVAQQYGVAGSTALYTIGQDGKIAAAQMGPQLDLNQAAAPLMHQVAETTVSETKTDAADGQAVAAPPTGDKQVVDEKTETTLSQSETAEAPDAAADNAVPSGENGYMGGGMPSVPSPQTDDAQPPAADMQAQPMSYDIPPSNPEFGHVADRALAI